VPESQATVLLLAKQPRNLALMREVLAGSNYRVLGYSALAQAAQALQQGLAADAALLDSSGYGSPFWTICQQLHHADVPFSVISAQQSRRIELESVQYGAQGVVVKPLTKQLLVQLAANLVAL